MHQTRIKAITELKADLPIFTGSHNGWQSPTEMLPIIKFSDFMDRQKF